MNEKIMSGKQARMNEEIVSGKLTNKWCKKWCTSRDEQTNNVR